MMKDNGSVMAENPPPPFKLEREITLMPNEFRERLSASHRSRNSSAARSANTKKTAVRSAKQPQLNHSVSIGQLNAFSEELDNGMDLAYQNPETMYQPFTGFSSPREADQYQDNKTETSAIELDAEVKFMLDNAYTNYEAGNSYSIRTPPSNMQIRDLMMPLDDWGSKETIREKKYAVLPSIKSPNSEKSYASTKFSGISDLSFNNQLDFGRDKMEQEADFFADFRVNTSRVRPTPRQDPLPPIQNAPGTSFELSPRAQFLEHQRQSSTKSKSRGRSKERQKFIL